ncbi:MAG: PRC-barrel domain-containing protein [Firmicutes bacterium]|nr:PRC-barrel domain-containing protein [Bacillota bacterium]
MLSGWHMTHLPVRVRSRPHPWKVVDEVIVSWATLTVEGFVLVPRLFGIPLITRDDRVFLTSLGIEIEDKRQVQMKSRRWKTQAVRRDREFRRHPVVDQTGQLCGRVIDFLFDDKTWHVTHLVVSRGILGDLVSGALIVPIADIMEMGHGVIKISRTGAPFSEK